MEITAMDHSLESTELQEKIYFAKLSEIIPLEFFDNMDETEGADETADETAILNAATSYIQLLEKLIDTQLNRHTC